MKKQWIIAAALSCALIGASTAAHAQENATATADDYQPPVMRKTGPTEKIIVLDISRDWQNQDTKEAQSAMQAIACLQGLVNRDAKTKIYLTNWPWRLGWDWPTTKAKDPNWKHPGEAALEDNLLPFPHTRATLDEGKSFPP